MTLETRQFLNWSETAQVLGYDDEGLRQAFMTTFSGIENQPWLPVCINSKNREFLARLDWEKRSIWLASEAKIGDFHGTDADAVFSDGTVFKNQDRTDSASWTATHHHRTGYTACYFLGGRLVLDPAVVRYACEEGGDLRPFSLRVAPREWCINEFASEELSFYLLRPESPGYAIVPEHLSKDAFFYTEDVLRIKNMQNPKTSVSEVSATTGSRWPWGDHETELLRHLAAAAKEWWSTYDSEDPTTAPISDDVRDWLIERGVSDRNAEVMATILRPAGLKPGPRKKLSAPKKT
jgi:hypothetical protein